MKHPLFLSATCAALALAACQPTPPSPSPSDASVAYTGETTNGALPLPEDVPPGEEWIEDAGPFVIDPRCCSVVFQIPAEEPDDATGVVRASIDGLRDGLPLARTDAGWSASFCMPLNAVIPYHYEFTFAPDAGADDAGIEPVAGTDAGPVTVVRASMYGLTASDGQGGQTNVYQVAEDCSAADASVGLRP